MDDLRLMLADNVVVAETLNAKYPDLVAFIEGAEAKWVWFRPTAM
jgi:hypothetical protein